MADKDDETRSISLEYCLRIGGDAIEHGDIANEGQWVRDDNTLMRFENEGVSQPVVRPGVLNVFFLQICDDGIVVRRGAVAKGRLKSVACIA